MAFVDGKRFWSVASGTAEAGSSAVAGIACGLAAEGRSVVLVDVGTPGHGVSRFFGATADVPGFDAYVQGRVGSLDALLIQTSTPGLRILCGGAGLAGLAVPAFPLGTKLRSEIAALDADVIITDLGSADVERLDFFNGSDVRIVVTGTGSAAICSSYSFIRHAVLRRIIAILGRRLLLNDDLLALLDLDGNADIGHFLNIVHAIDPAAANEIMDALNDSRFKLIVSDASDLDGQRTARALAALASQYIMVSLEYAGTASASICTTSADHIHGGAASRQLARALVELAQRPHLVRQSRQDRGEAKDPVTGISTEVLYGDQRLHIQTEAIDRSGHAGMLTIIFHRGRILLSKKTAPDEMPEHAAVLDASDRVKWHHRAIMAGILSGTLDLALSRNITGVGP